MPDRPEIVCICGSTRFVDQMRAANRDLTFAGAIVVAPGVFLMHLKSVAHRDLKSSNCLLMITGSCSEIDWLTWAVRKI